MVMLEVHQLDAAEILGYGSQSSWHMIRCLMIRTWDLELMKTLEKNVWFSSSWMIISVLQCNNAKHLISCFQFNSLPLGNRAVPGTCGNCVCAILDLIISHIVLNMTKTTVHGNTFMLLFFSNYAICPEAFKKKVKSNKGIATDVDKKPDHNNKCYITKH